MRKVFRFLFYSALMIAFVSSAESQTLITATLLDANNKKVVPYCAVGLLHSSKGCLSNEEGVFSIRVYDWDTLVFSSIGYRKKTLAVKELLQTGVVELTVSEKILEEITVLAKDERAYLLLSKSRKALMGSPSCKAKTYFMLSSEIQGQPVELLECYYSATLNNNRVAELVFKNGRVGLAPYTNRYFVSLDISGAFTLLNLLYEDKRMPKNPYQLSTKALKRNYIARLEESYDSLSPIQIVSFQAIDSLNAFSGRVHILRSNFLPLKIELSIHSTLHHPFRPLFPNAQIQGADLRFTKAFELRNDSLYTHHIDFDYTLNYQLATEKRQIVSKGLLYFYDYHNPFLPILYPFNPYLDDYKKINSASYNEAFWRENQVMEYSGNMRTQRDFLEKNGLTLNYINTLKIQTEGSNNRDNFFESNDLIWSGEKRLSIAEDKIRNDTTGKAPGTESQYRVNNYAFKANIYLDANPSGDSLQHYSVSVLDVQQSFYHLKTDLYTDCFLNIYFDLVEIERRKMEKEIARNSNSWAHIQDCYKQAQKNMEETGLRYFTEVKRGQSRKKLEEWNKYVYDQLKIDNFEIYELHLNKLEGQQYKSRQVR